MFNRLHHGILLELGGLRRSARRYPLKQRRYSVWRPPAMAGEGAMRARYRSHQWSGQHDLNGSIMNMTQWTVSDEKNPRVASNTR